MNILIADKFEAEGIAALKALGCEVATKAGLDAAGITKAIADTKAQILIVRSTKVPAAVINASPTLKLIIRAGAGVDNIDVPAATAAKLPVCNCPGMNADAVAELTIGLLVCCDRRIPDQVSMLREGKWDKGEFGKARGLKGKTLVIVGIGSIGLGVAKRASAFGMNVIAWSRSLDASLARGKGLGFGGNSRGDLLKAVSAADAVSIHVAATADTKRLANAEFFAAMKTGAMFINTSRGDVVDEAALREAIKSKGIRAGLDVFEGEPADKAASWKPEIASLPGVYATHHCGASTDQAQLAVADETVRIVREFKASGATLNRVN